MDYHVESRWGGSENRPNEHRMREILAELDESDPEHPDTWLTHESGWTLAVFESGLVICENLESSEEPRHLVDVSREKALELWLKLSRGEFDAIHQETWCPGYGPPINPEEREKLAKEAEEHQRASDRKFYDQLSPERKMVPCRHSGCQRGAISFGVFCRVHHFESIYHRPCPFDD